MAISDIPLSGLLSREHFHFEVSQEPKRARIETKKERHKLESPEEISQRQRLAFLSLQRAGLLNRAKRMVTHPEKAENPSSAPETQPSVSIDDIYGVFQESVRDKPRASFTPEQGQKILDFYRQEKDSSWASPYRKMSDHYHKLGNFSHLAQELDEDVKSIGEIIAKTPSIKALEDHVAKWGGDRSSNLEKLLFKTKTAAQFISDLLSKNMFTAELPIRALVPPNDWMQLRNSVLILGKLNLLYQQILQENTKPEAERNIPESQTKERDLQTSLKRNIAVLKKAFEKYMDFKKETRFLSVPLSKKDHFANISQFINHRSVSSWCLFPELKREFVFNLSLFFSEKNLIKPRELDNFQGIDLEKIDELVKTAIKKYKSSLGVEHSSYPDSELRIYKEDQSKYVICDWRDVKHVAERHYPPTFNPSAKKIYNTKFKGGMTLDKIVETLYQRIHLERESIFNSTKEYHAIVFSIDGQTYNIGISIAGNKKILEGNKKIGDGRQKITEGQRKVNEGTTQEEKGKGQKAIKVGERLVEEGTRWVNEGAELKSKADAYKFKQFYPEPRNAVVFVMPPDAMTNPEGHLDFRYLMAAFGRRYDGYRIPATYYALIFNKDSSVSIKQLASDPTSAVNENWVWTAPRQSLGGVYTKVTLVGYGNHGSEGGLIVRDDPISSGVIRTIKSDAVGNAFASVFSGSGAEVQSVRLLACHQQAAVFGQEIHRALKKRGVKTEQIIGSESEVYIANKELNSKSGIKAASKYYLIASGEAAIARGVREAKWVIDVDASGNMKGEPRSVASHGDPDNLLDIAVHSDAVSGPFGQKAKEVALNLQRASQAYSDAEQQVNEALTKMDGVIGEIKDVATRLFNKEKSGWFVAIDKWRQTGEGYFIHVLEKESLNWKEVLISKEKWDGFLVERERLKRACDILKVRLEKGADGELRFKSSVQPAAHPHTLNSGFLAMALIGKLRDSQVQMSPEIKVSIYWNLVGAATGVAEDLVELSKLVTTPGIVQRSLQTVSRFVSTSNMIFMLGDLGWNFYQLATEKDPVVRVGIGIQTGFTLGAVVLQGGSAILAGLAPATAEMALATSGFVAPVMAIGMGFSVLGSQIKQNNMKMHALFAHLLEAKKGYQIGGFTKNNNLLVPDPNTIITKIDFHNSEITFGGQRVKKSKYEGWYRPSSPYDFQLHDWERFNLREAYGISKTYQLDTSVPEILLPCTPHLTLDYEFNNVFPSISEAEEQIGEELTRTGNFAAKNSVGDLRPGFTSTRGIRFHPLTLSVRLDNKERCLWFNHEINENMSYDIQGGGGRVFLRGLHSGVRLTLREATQDQNSSFALDVAAPLLDDGDINLIDGILTIKEAQGKVIRVDVSKLNGVIRVVGMATTWHVNLETKQILLDTLDLRRATQLATPQLYLNYLKALAEKGRTEGVVRLVQGRFPSALGQDATAEQKESYWRQIQQAELAATHSAYDSKANTIIVPRSLLSNRAVLSGSKLVGVTERCVFFFHSENKTFWHVNRETSEVTHYEMGFVNDQTHIELAAKNENQLIIRQSSLLEKDRVDLIHLVEGSKIKPIALRGLSNEAFKRAVQFLDSLKKNEASQEVNNHFLYDAGYAFRQMTRLKKSQQVLENTLFYQAQFPEWLTIEGIDEDGFQQRILADFKKGHRVRLNTYHISRLQLVKNWEEEGTFLFWSPDSQKAYFARAEAKSPELSLVEVYTDGKRVVWCAPNENVNKIDLITEEGKDVITVNARGSLIKTLECPSGQPSA